MLRAWGAYSASGVGGGTRPQQQRSLPSCGAGGAGLVRGIFPFPRCPSRPTPCPSTTKLCSLDGGKASSSYSQQGWVGSDLNLDGEDQQSVPSPQAAEEARAMSASEASSDEGGSRASSSGSSWEDWLAVFEEMDVAAESLQDLQAQLQLAVQFEEYGRAAALKRQIEDLQAKDMVRNLQHELASALGEERYADAARLRDEGLASLQGWWAGKAEGDPLGHILYVGPEFGRWTGRAYTASDLADLCGLRESGSPLMRIRTRGAMFREKQEKRKDKGSIGSPAMEVFLKPGPDGSTQHQPVSLIGNMPLSPGAVEGLKQRPTWSGSTSRGTTITVDTKEVEERRKQAAKAMSSSLGPVVQLTVSIEADGSASIKALPTPPPEPKSSLEGSAADEAAAAMKELSELADPPKPESTQDSKLAQEYWFGLGEEDRKAGEANIQRHKDEQEKKDAEGPSASSSQAQEQGGQGNQVVEPDAIVPEPSREDQQQPPRSDASSSSSGKDKGEGPGSSGWGWIDVRGLGSAKEIEEAVKRGIERGGGSTNSGSGSTDSSGSGSSASGASGTAESSGESGGGGGATSGGRETQGGAGSGGERAESGREDKRGGGVNRGSRSGALGEKEEGVSELSRLPAHVEMQGRDAFVLRLPREGVKAAESSPAQQVAEKPLATFEVLIPVRQFMGDSSGKGDASSLRGPISEALTRVAIQLTSMQAMQTSSSKITPEIMSEALQVVANRLTSGEATTLRISSTGASFSVSDPYLEQSGSRQGAGSSTSSQEDEDDEKVIHRQVMEAMNAMGDDMQKARQPQLQPETSVPIRYARVPLDAPRTDPFSGIYIGSFGPHGPEALQVQRTIMDGEEAVLATKLTGDPNVPAGSPSFRAKVDRKYKLNARDVYPDELGVIGRYKGEGRVAQRGNVEPRWVDGELLVFAVGASPLTAGAELGFVFVVPGEKRFLILLNKCELPFK